MAARTRTASLCYVAMLKILKLYHLGLLIFRITSKVDSRVHQLPQALMLWASCDCGRSVRNPDTRHIASATTSNVHAII